ncbi:unnamed protein product [Rhizopus stolonifer]
MLTAPYANPNSTKRVEMNEDMVTMVDYTNLYIKNLDRDVTSKTLFELFRVFGEIVSARVMKDTQTGISRGYGFVSFKQMEDAQEALRQMNGFRVHTKHISVNFHEHKKPQPQPRIQKSDPIIYSSPIEQKSFIQPWQETIWMPTTMQIPPAVSPMTTSPLSIQEHKLREVIDSQLAGHQKGDLKDLVDLIQSLDKRELSLCLFNTAFLKQQIEKAYEVIDLFKEKQQTTSISTTPSLDHRQLEDDNDSIAALLSSLEGMTSNKQKRVLGDILFPLVKATGIRHAPKVTIQLLDTLALEELANTMYNKQALTNIAYRAYIQIYGENVNPFSKALKK